jgi:hypothetical protein
VFTSGFVVESIGAPEPADVLREDASGAQATLSRRASLAELEASAEGWAWEPALRGTLWIKVRGGASRVVPR